MLFIEEAGFPIPIADGIIIYTGYLISRGHISFTVALIGLLFADLAGVSLLYYLSSRYGQKLIVRFGKYMHLSEKKLFKVEQKYRKYGPLFIIFGRHIPGFRVPTTVFSGMSEVTYPTFIASTFISIIWWIPLYLAIGQNLGAKAKQLIQAHLQYTPLLALLPILAIAIPIFLLRDKKK